MRRVWNQLLSDYVYRYQTMGVDASCPPFEVEVGNPMHHDRERGCETRDFYRTAGVPVNGTRTYDDPPSPPPTVNPLFAPNAFSFTGTHTLEYLPSSPVLRPLFEPGALFNGPYAWTDQPPSPTVNPLFAEAAPDAFPINVAPAFANDSLQCCICLSEPKCVVFMPCRHMCACEECGLSGRLARCPLCTRKIDTRYKVFL